MPDVPANHRQAERILIRFVRRGDWRIDREGRIWRVRLWTGRSIAPRRAEKAAREYLMVRAMCEGRRVCGLSHRLVWHHFRGQIPDGLVINHINGDKQDNRPDNLELATYSENALHAHRVLSSGREQRGAKNCMAKLTRAEVIDIRRRRAAGEALASIGASFGVSDRTVSKIVRGERWSHIGGPITLAEAYGGWRHQHASAAARDEAGRFAREGQSA